MQRSLSFVNSDSIRKHPANNSSSKNAYAFSKTKRFPQPNPQCKNSFYQEKLTQLSNRKASFGYGTKTDFTKTLQVSPSPDNYQIKSCFDLNKDRGSSFGITRERLPDQSYTIPQLRHVPGPGQYEHNRQTLSPIKYTMRTKPKDFIEEKMTNKKNPGPGSYQTLNMDPKTGRFQVAKYGDIKFGKIEPNLKRFQKIQSTNTPSAFQYLQKDGMNPSAKYILSKNKGSGIRSFSSSKRLTFIDETQKSIKHLPGPGNYDRPSDFGVYGTFGDNVKVQYRQPKTARAKQQ